MSEHMALFMPKGPTKIRITMNLKNPTYAQHACFQHISNTLYDDEDDTVAGIVHHMTDLGMTKLHYKGLPHARSTAHKALCSAGFIHPRQDMLVTLGKDCVMLRPSPFPNDLAWEDDLVITIDRVMTEEKILTNERQAEVVGDTMMGIAAMLTHGSVEPHKSNDLPHELFYQAPAMGSFHEMLNTMGVSGEEYMSTPELCQDIEKMITKAAGIHDVSVSVPMFDKAPCTRNDTGVWHINVSGIIGNLDVIRIDEVSLLKYFHRRCYELRTHCMRQDVLALAGRKLEIGNGSE